MHHASFHLDKNYMYGYFPMNFFPSTHRLSLGECHTEENLLISLSLQEHLRTPLHYLSSHLHHFFVLIEIFFLPLFKALMSYMNRIHRHNYKFSVTRSVGIFIYLIPPLFIYIWLRLERNPVCHSNPH